MPTEPQSDWGPSFCEHCFYDLTEVEARPPRHAPCPNCGSYGDDPAGDRLSDFLVSEACLPAIGSCTKDEAVRQMVEALLSTGQVPGVSTDDVMARWRKREELGTTGIGHHIAVPHIRHPKVERLVGCLAHSVEGIDFDTLDDEPVHLLMFYLIPADRPKEAFRALDLLARMV